MKPEFRPSAVLSRPSLAAVMLAGALVLVGCGSDDDDDDESGGGAGDSPGLFESDTGGEQPGAGSSPSPTIDEVPLTAEITALGTVYVDRETRRSLYIRPSDPPGEVICLDACAEDFPPLLTDIDFMGISEPFDIIVRPDGENQWTYGDYPLHRYTGDGDAGEANGEGIDERWYLARPIPISSVDSAIGEVLAVSGTTVTGNGRPTERNDFDGYTLYTFDGDGTEDGALACTDICPGIWQPLYADLAAQPNERYTLRERDDGTLQWTYEGAPLYVYAGDDGPGELNGAEIEGWSPVAQ